MADFSPELHPRDPGGKFARKGLIHHTAPERAKLIRDGGFKVNVASEHGSLFGLGVNLSTDERSGRLYNAESTRDITGYNAERINVSADVRNPYRVTVPTGSFTPGEYLEKQMRRDGLLAKGETIGRGRWDPRRGPMITAALQREGYDAVEVVEVGGISHEVGGNQLIVFDPARVHVEAPAPRKAPARPKSPARRVTAPAPAKTAPAPSPGVANPKATAAGLRESAAKLEKVGLKAKAQVLRDRADELDPR
jgi:hypothetical protein